MIVEPAKIRLDTTLDVVERVLEPADGEQERDARRGALGVAGSEAIEQTPERLRTAERADDREVEVAVAEAHVAPVQQARERATRGGMEQGLGLDVGVQQHRLPRLRLHLLERAALARDGFERPGFEQPGEPTLEALLRRV